MAKLAYTSPRGFDFLEMLMAEPLWKPYLDALQNGWGTYVERVKQLSPQRQAEFLERQGYVRLGDLLGHVIAWWEDGLPAIEEMLIDPSRPSQEYDVDAFNAQAVKRFSSIDEATIIQDFEAMRNAWIRLVESLPEGAFSNKKLLSRLHIELIGHLEEHKIPEP
jgi:hypothetical protein